MYYQLKILLTKFIISFMLVHYIQSRCTCHFGYVFISFYSQAFLNVEILKSSGILRKTSEENFNFIKINFN